MTAENIVRISITTTAPGKMPQIEDIHFTNVPMHRVHAAINMLNGDPFADALNSDRDDTPPTLKHLIEQHGKAVAKMMYSAMYGRPNTYPATGANEYVYKDTDSAMPEGTREYTLTELFGWYDGTPHCHECGATVDHEQRNTHRLWHNKLLP